MAIYYVDSINGSDSNNGTSADGAFQSIAKISATKLKPGDVVLLARGSAFADMLTINGSGTPESPITFAAYGEGADPKFVGDKGIYGTKMSNIVIQELAFETGYTSIYAAQAHNWVIDNVTLNNAGHATGTGSISMKNSTNVTISNSKFDNVSNDGIYVVNMDGLNIINNVMTNLHGHTADGIQVTDSNNVRAEGNVINLTTALDSTKGGIIMNGVTNVVADDNQVIGGSFGIAINGWNIAITDNKISGQTKYGWSAAIMASQGVDLGNYTITGNDISDANFGIAFTGLARDGAVTRENIDVSNNLFTSIINAALKIDKETSGNFHGNVLVDSVESYIRGDGMKGEFTLSDNLSTTLAQLAEALKARDDAAAGNPPKAPPLTPLPGGDQPDVPVTEVPQSGDTPAPVDSGNGGAANPGTGSDGAPAPAPVVLSENLNKALKIGVNADRYAMDVAGGPVIGNVLLNDINAGGETAALRTVGGTRIDAKGMEIEGKYGVLKIALDGSFSYTLAADAVDKLKSVAAPAEHFQYKANDGTKVVTSSLSIDLSDYSLARHPDGAVAQAIAKAALPPEKAKAIDDLYVMDSNSLSIQGNVSANDLTASGDTLSLRTVGNAHVDAGPLGIKGDYGTLTIDASGNFTYALHDNASSLLAGGGKASETFTYKAAIGNSYDVAALVIDLADHVPVPASELIVA